MKQMTQQVYEMQIAHRLTHEMHWELVSMIVLDHPKEPLLSY